jgi:hypothetical protein
LRVTAQDVRGDLAERLLARAPRLGLGGGHDLRDLAFGVAPTTGSSSAVDAVTDWSPGRR